MAAAVEPINVREVSGSGLVDQAASKPPGQAEPKLVRGMLQTERKTEALADLVVTVLRDRGWGSVSVVDVKVEQKSGVGSTSGQACFKVSAENADPPIVALHIVSEHAASASDFLSRMADAHKIFSDSRLGPRRLAHGGDWFIEVWEGIGQPEFKTEDKFKELGKLLADVHKLPVEWFDTWRDKACERRPVLRKLPHGSHVWWFTCKTWECYEALPSDEECLQFWVKDAPCFAPSSNALHRLVTSHGDCHPGNLVETDSGMRLLDFEYTTVSSAAFDVGFVFMWAGSGPEGKKNKLAFLEQYMASSGLPTDAQSVENLYLDAEIHVMATHCKDLWAAVHSSNKKRMNFLESLILKARENREAVNTIMDQGIEVAMEFLEFEMIAEKTKDFSNYHRLISDEGVDQCWYVKTNTRQVSLQVNLADGSYARFNASGSQYLGHGAFTMKHGVYGESSREGIEGYVLGDQANFQITIGDDEYIPLAEDAFPWAVRVARAELKKDVLSDHFSFSELSANGNQLCYVVRQNGNRFFQYNLGASRKFVLIPIKANAVHVVGNLTCESGTFVAPGPPGFQGYIPVRWDLIDWADDIVKKTLQEAQDS